MAATSPKLKSLTQNGPALGQCVKRSHGMSRKAGMPKPVPTRQILGQTSNFILNKNKMKRQTQNGYIYKTNGTFFSSYFTQSLRI